MRRLVLAIVLALGSLAFAAGYPAAVFPTFSGVITTETTVATAAAGTHLTIQSAVAQVTTAGIVVLRDGTAGTVIANVYLTSTPTQIGAAVFGAHGLTLTQSNLTATLSGSTLTLLLRCEQQ